MSDLSVYEAFSKVMGAVQGIGKGERNATQGFNFRGIDSVMNAVGPALREFGVTIIPDAESIEVERYTSKAGAQMKNTTVRMRYTVFGPKGDSFAGSAYGEAADSGDKSVSKAQSVAYRTFLLQGLTVPTNEPDPDAEIHERAEYQPDPLDVAKRELATAVTQAGMDPREFAAWAMSARGPGLNIRECADIGKIEALTKQVQAGTVDISPTPEQAQQTLESELGAKAASSVGASVRQAYAVAGRGE